MRRRRSAAAAQDIDLAMLGPFADKPRGGIGHFVIFAEFVGQPGVRIDHHQRVGDIRQHADLRAQLRRAERAVEADRQRLGMAHRIPERLDRMARQVAAAERSEEHTSELQSLMRTQYAVFWLKKKRKTPATASE